MTFVTVSDKELQHTSYGEVEGLLYNEACVEYIIFIG